MINAGTEDKNLLGNQACAVRPFGPVTNRVIACHRPVLALGCPANGFLKPGAADIEEPLLLHFTNGALVRLLQTFASVVSAVIK
jgi:hypothetical protein